MLKFEFSSSYALAILILILITANTRCLGAQLLVNNQRNFQTAPVNKSHEVSYQVGSALFNTLTPIDRFSLSSLLNLNSNQKKSKSSAYSGAIECGQRVASYDSRIVGGHVATIGDFP